MAYPPAPWTLQGHALQTFQLLDVERVRPLIPSELEIVQVLPGKTVGGIYLSYYGSGSVMEYSELIVNAAMVRYTGKVGAWVSHIYVDNPDSVAGGREIWGLPKELAEFRWEKGSSGTAGYENRVIVRQGEQTLCRFSYNQPSFGLPVPIGGDVFSTLSNSILLFKGELKSQVGVVGSKLLIPIDSPFASLDLTQPWLTIYCDRLHLVAGVPIA
ncbi:MAG: acetoacetate decarboxylase family protein, partial [Coleofasciculus sp. S288]|nr:acetoacetate decarboxylase family protein [Coleofasciculus sp. S288]